MAQGDTIQAKVGDLVEVSFTLDYKKAAVSQRPDRNRYSHVGFMIECPVGGKENVGEPPSVKVTADDQQITAIFSFKAPDFLGPDFFVAGDTWSLKAFYHDGQDLAIADPILLGHVKLAAA